MSNDKVILYLDLHNNDTLIKYLTLFIYLFIPIDSM